MNVLQICSSDKRGGAAIASLRLHQCLNYNSHLKINSEMRVIRKVTNDDKIISKNNIFHRIFFPKYLSLINKIYRSSFATTNPATYSTALIKTGLGRELNNQKYYNKFDIFHLHYLGDITMSIEEIGNLKKPIVWTLHDQWPFCGAEHYLDLNIMRKNQLIDKRYYSSYSKLSRLEIDYGIDINRLTWLRKKKYWKKNFHIVCPSKWMEECACKSSLFKNFPIHTIPNPISTDLWKPISKYESRKILNISLSKKIILFGAVNTNEERKGAKLLLKALKILIEIIPKEFNKHLELVVFGKYKKKNRFDINLPIKFIGELKDTNKLNMVYSSADVFVNPSIQESFGQTASEAHASGTPVVAFNTGGLKDIIKHLETGYLANPFDPKSLAHGIKWVLENEDRNFKLGLNSRKRAIRNWDYSIVSKKYSELYNNVIK
tara:strand:+ start:314 stop:1612 length:1299 start_codon:yes stop_codon:yes gene_type:complete